MDFEEVKRLLDETEKRLKSLGDSLWPTKAWERTKRLRRKDNARWVLEWPKK